MIDTLAGKTQNLIIIESNQDILTWLQEWKHMVVDKQATSSFALWQDEIEHQNENSDAYRRCGGSEATIAHGIESSDSGLIIVPNIELQAL